MNLLKKRMDSRGGLIRTVIFVVIVLLVISYFGINIRAIVNSPAGQENFTYVQQVMVDVWNGYLKKPVLYLWNDIFLDLIWNPAIENLKKIKNGETTDVQTAAPKLTTPQPIPN